MLGNSSFLESSRRESRKRRRLSERRRVFSRLNGGSTSGGNCNNNDYQNLSLASSRDRRRSSIFKREHQIQQADEGEQAIFLMPTGDQGKISMKIQFHITIAPDNEPLLLDSYQLGSAPNSAPQTPQDIVGEQNLSKRQYSTESSSAIGEHINERLNRQGSSTKRRQQLLAMHQQSALDRQQQQHNRTSNNAVVRSGSITDTVTNKSAQEDRDCFVGRESGMRSSTISGGMQDEATLKFLATHQQQQQNSIANQLRSGSMNSTNSLVNQHQTLMSSSNNIRQRNEQREHIYFKRDGQRFGHEFTLKLAVDKSYRCLLKVRPLIPLEALSIQGHHVSFVDCSANSSFSSTSSSSGLGNSLSSSAPTSSMTLSNGAGDPSSLNMRNQTIGNILSSPRHNSIAVPQTSSYNQNHLNSRFVLNGQQTSSQNNQRLDHQYNHHQHHGPGQHQMRRLNHAQTTIGTSNVDRRTSILNFDLEARSQQANRLDTDKAVTGSSTSISSNSTANARKIQQQLLKQQQYNQMLRHFSGASSLSSSHSGGQLVYMFDWSASRFEVNKNKARTQMQTVLKFKNGQILSLPLQVKFYQPECRQHLSWGSQLHFIDYDCNIDSMGQMNVDRVQYY